MALIQVALVFVSNLMLLEKWALLHFPSHVCNRNPPRSLTKEFIQQEGKVAYDGVLVKKGGVEVDPVILQLGQGYLQTEQICFLTSHMIVNCSSNEFYPIEI